MLGWFLAGLFVAAVAVIVIHGCITKARLKEKLREQGVKDAMIEKIDHCDNVVTLKDLDKDREYEIRGDDVDWDLYEGQVLYV